MGKRKQRGFHGLALVRWTRHSETISDTCSFCCDQPKRVGFCMETGKRFNLPCLMCMNKFIDVSLFNDNMEYFACCGCDKDLIEHNCDVLTEGNKDLMKKLDKYLITRYVVKTLFTYFCPTPDCETILENRKVCGRTVTCPGCKKKHCTGCRQSMDQCECSVDKKAEKGDGFKTCPSCYNKINKNGGCHTVTCICGDKYCYYCMKRVCDKNCLGRYETY